MSVDQSILRAARFKRSQSQPDNDLQVFWSTTNDFNFQNKAIRVRVAQHRKKSILTFEYQLPKRGCTIPKVLSAHHNTLLHAHRLSPNIFSVCLTQHLNSYTPIQLLTKQIVCFKPSKSSLSVVHIPNPTEESSLTTYVNHWQTYVELCEIKGEVLEYFCVFEVQAERGWVVNRMLPGFVREVVDGVVRSLQAIQEEMVVEIVQVMPKVSEEERRKNDPCWSEEHLRLPHCTEKEREIVFQMKKKFPDAADNALIRFLTAKNYDLEVASKCYEEYLIWKEGMKKYSLADFKSIMDKKLFTYIGKDHKGRPVVFNKAANVIPDQLDEDLYCIFYTYFIQIYIVSKMQGYVDQIMVIADGQGLGTKNFKMSLTKKNLDGLLKYSPERQSKLIAVHANWFGLTIWTILKPLLPKKTLNKIDVIGYDDKKILNTLLAEMDISIIPEQLGGKNKNLWQDC